ncbi:MAG: patatin-like phospholipase family protein [Pseudomonadota bacterium]
MATTTTTDAAPASENELITNRRTIAQVDDKDPRYGLALSGGGIRSATFCFGLLRGLAREKVLTRFDYLSTVSGGGYVGSALGRLYQGDHPAPRVQERLDQDDTLLLWWLRSNGRYLTPAGARDLGQAAASILRNVLFSHFEVAALMLLCATIMLLPYAAMATSGVAAAWGWQTSGSVWPSAFWGTAGSVWWCAMVLPVFAALHYIFRYWYCRAWPNGAARLANLGGALLAGVAGAWLMRAVAAHWNDESIATLAAKAGFAFWLFAPGTAALLSLHSVDPALQAARRLRYTKLLGVMLWALLGLALVGLLDFGAWWLADYLGESERGRTFSGINMGALAALFAAAHKILPAIQRWMATLPAKAVKTEVMLNAVGLLLVLWLALMWVTVLHALVRPELGWTLWPAQGAELQPYSSVVNWGMVFAISVAYVGLTRTDFEVLNLSSLHNFYRARIERAYVSVGNYTSEENKSPNARFPYGSPLNTATPIATNSVAKLIEAVDGDDINLDKYEPHVHGGPIHLITCCINQSVDDRTGNYNADRLGIALTVSALGAETGTERPVLLQPQAMGKLSRWIAISGAAAASGMGSQTTPGQAALMFLSGLRLGFWTPRLLPPEQAATRRASTQSASDVARKSLAALFPKPAYLLAEFLARFPGLRNPAWYVSDGGHFENTGVYALLKRKLDVVVVADCGADPRYGFDDLENLARKAEIDYGASIAFVDPATLVAQSAEEAAVFARVGSVANISTTHGPQSLLLARIHYDGCSTPGLLIVVKPRVVDGMPLEITGYATRNAPFPQEPTSDQLFDEAQWEAYHQLGLRLGQQLTAQAIGILLKHVCPSSVPCQSTPGTAAA